MMWWLVSALAIAALEKFFFRGQNAVWGGATIGAIIGVVIAIFRPGFDWETVGQSAVIGAFIGLLAEILGAIGDRMRPGG
jgi:ElaB/YqjD/DUF883 family membrane-anchored ribosome-binding protein